MLDRHLVTDVLRTPILHSWPSNFQLRSLHSVKGMDKKKKKILETITYWASARHTILTRFAR